MIFLLPYALGSTYRGRTNVRTRHDVCGFCRMPGVLRSFDATEYLSIAFVPVVPLGRRHVTDLCPVCNRHLGVSLKQWRRTRDVALAQTSRAQEANPHDPNAALAAMKAAVDFQSEADFDKAAERTQKGLARHVEVLLAVGEGHLRLGRAEPAEAAYRKALQLTPPDQPDPRAVEALAVLLLRLGRTDEGWELIRRLVVRGRRHDKVPLAYVAVEAYQARSMHPKAVEILHEAATAFPGLAGAREFLYYWNLSQNGHFTKRPPQSRNLPPVKATGPKSRPLAVLAARAYLPTVLLLLFGLYAGTNWLIGQNRQVYVVNGLDEPYAAEVGGQRVDVGAKSYRSIRVPEGELPVRVLNPDGSVRSQTTVTLTTPFFSRLFVALRELYVVNPDRAALLGWEQVEYVADNLVDNSNRQPYEGASQLYAGELMYHFTGIDHPFEAFPERIQMQHGGRERRERVWVMDDLTPSSAACMIYTSLGEQRAAEYLRGALERDPDDSDVLTLAPALLEPTHAAQLLRPHLSDRPVRIPLHRAYQRAVQRANPNSDPAGEYRAFLEREPDDAALAYLLGRVTADRAEAVRLFERAAASDNKPAAAWANHDLAVDRLAAADFTAALDRVRSALALDSEPSEFKAVERDALEALGHFQALVDECRPQRDAEPGDYGLAAREAYLMVRSGRALDADAVVDQYSRHGSQSGWAAVEVQQYRDYLDSVVRYARGDAEGYVASADQSGLASEKFAAAMTAGRLDEAEPLSAGRDEEAYDRLLLYVAASGAGRAELAERSLRSAVKLLRGEGPEARRLARWLSASAPPDPDEACGVVLHPDQKRTALTALGIRHPRDRARYFAEAARLNYSRWFPHLLLKHAHEGTNRPAAPGPRSVAAVVG